MTAYGRNIPNYHHEDITHLRKLYEASKLVNPAVIVDVSHMNSNRMFREQPRVAFEVLNDLKYDPSLRGFVKGFMIESYLVEGHQDPTEGVYGKSITDACLGWDDSEKLVLRIAELV
jgi:3-deoxy-7-phosphoheptulonate synthase